MHRERTESVSQILVFEQLLNNLTSDSCRIWISEKEKGADNNPLTLRVGTFQEENQFTQKQAF